MTVVEEQRLLEAPRVSLAQIRVHPLNPRINATADEEMVESIRQVGVLDPIMLAPAVDGDGWVLIDGHRRFDGAQRAGADDVPANPRYDLVTEAQQVEVMAITGLQKQLLSPIEEAAAYEQLTLLGMDVAAIAASTGFSRDRVKSRIKLNTLSTVSRGYLHEGQLTLGDAEAMLEFADDPEVTAKLEEAAGTNNFRFTVANARGSRDRAAKRAARVAELTAAGALQVESVPGRPGYVFAVADPDRAEIAAIGMHGFTDDLREPEGHDGCLGFYVPVYDYADIHVVCIDPRKHKADEPDSFAVEAARAARASEWEQQQAERDAARARAEAASAARLAWLVDHFAGVFPARTHKALGDAARVLLPCVIVDGRETVTVDRVLNAHGVVSGPTTAWGSAEGLADKISAGTPGGALDSFSRYLAAQISEYLDLTWVEGEEDGRRLLALWDWLAKAGYPMSDADTEHLAALAEMTAEYAGEEDGD